MKFLKALKKTHEEGSEVDLPSEDMAPAVGKFQNVVPGFFEEQNLKIDLGQSVTTAEISDNSENSHITGDVAPTANGDHHTRTYPTVFVDQDLVNPHLVAITEPKSAFCEEYRNLRTTLLQKRKKHKLKTIAVVSVAPSEGKTVTALNLAWLLAQTEGITALAIDGDLRLPSLSRYVGHNSDIGLSEVLDGDIELQDAIVKLEPSGLHLLPGGHNRDDVGELMSGPTFANILSSTQSLFDFVIIDAPPLGVFVDAKVLINQTDGALLVLRSNYTNWKDLGRVLEDLPRDRMLGVVLNQAEETLISGRYYDYPYYRRD